MHRKSVPPLPRRTVLVVCDSLRADLVSAADTPALVRLGAESHRFTAHRSVFPSTTRTASASIATGCLPRSHGLLGNVVALDEGRGMAPVSTGKADYRERVRTATGRVLTRPTLAQLIATANGSGGVGAGGKGLAVIYSNATPGAAHVQDPDGHGFLFNRAGSHGPGLRPLPRSRHLETPKGIAGDARVTDRFVEEAVLGGNAPLSVLWLSEPDFSGHEHPLGSPDHRRAMAAADACVARVAEAVARLDPSGASVMLVVTSDHGQETTGRVIDVNALLIQAGLRAEMGSHDIVPTCQGTAVVFYAAESAQAKVPALISFLEQQDWCGAIFSGEALLEVGLEHGLGLNNGKSPRGGGIVAAVSMAKSNAANEYGIPGLSDIMFEEGGINNPGRGQHGGLGAYEQNPFLIIRGGGFRPGALSDTPSSCIDIAPTILRQLGLPPESWQGMDGRPLAFG